MFIQRVTVYPMPDKVRELRALVEERTKKRNTQGQRLSMQVPVFASDVGTVVVSIFYEDLAALEKVRHQNATDKDWLEYIGKVNALSSETASFELYEVVVELPPRKS